MEDGDYREVTHVETILAEYDKDNDRFQEVYQPYSKLSKVVSVHTDLSVFNEDDRFIVVTYDVIKKGKRKNELEHYYLIVE